MDYTANELMIVNASRALEGSRVVFVGVGLPNIACNLARRSHSPNIELVYESGVFGAQPARLPLSIGDPTLVSGAFLGYLFVTRGLATSIIFHFSTNFIFFSTKFWPDSQIVVVVVGLLLIIWMITGAYFFAKLIRGLIYRLAGHNSPSR